MKKSQKNALIIWAVFTLVLNFILYQATFSDAGPPVYLSREERANPMIIFWRFLPQTAVICGVIVGIGYLIYSFMNKSKSS